MVLVLILPERASATLSYEFPPSNLPLTGFKFVKKKAGNVFKIVTYLIVLRQAGKAY